MGLWNCPLWESLYQPAKQHTKLKGISGNLYTLPETISKSTWKWMVWRLGPGLFSGAIAVILGSACFTDSCIYFLIPRPSGSPSNLKCEKRRLRKPRISRKYWSFLAWNERWKLFEGCNLLMSGRSIISDVCFCEEWNFASMQFHWSKC